MKVSAVISWMIVIVIALGIPVLNHFSGRIEKMESAAREEGVDWQFEFLGKYSLGASRALSGQSKALTNQLGSQAKSPEQEIAAAIVTGEIEGRDAAIIWLEDITHPESDGIAAFYRTDAQKLSAPQFSSHYPWHFQLAEMYGKSDSDPQRAAVVGQADRMFRGAIIFFFSLLFVGAVGFVLLILAVILLATSWLKFKTQRVTDRGEVYIESFAIYLSTFFLMSLLVGLLPGHISVAIKMIPIGLTVIFAAAWPILRGIDFAQYRKTVGLHRGKGIFTEIACGVIGYLAGLPLVAFGLFITYFLMMFTSERSTHPIAFEVNQLSPVLLFGLACVFAPLTEELMFRGIFVSHLRSWTGITISALISGLVFAAIHPQGWVAIPVLGLMGVNFALIRQWRDSLIPSIAAHFLNNGVVVTLLLLASR